MLEVIGVAGVILILCFLVSLVAFRRGQQSVTPRIVEVEVERVVEREVERKIVEYHEPPDTHENTAHLRALGLPPAPRRVHAESPHAGVDKICEAFGHPIREVPEPPAEPETPSEESPE